MHEVVIVGGARTPVGDFNGSLASKNPVDHGDHRSKSSP